MPIYKIDQVKINGKNQAFGGYIYNVHVEIGLVDSPTTVSVTFLNEQGTYFEPELSPDHAYKIEIGNVLSGNFYAVSREFLNAVGQKLLKVDFVDGSIILNRIWVGLYKRHGDETTNIPGLLILGREIHPCDINEDGIFDITDAAQLALKGLDPCELRCPTDTNTKEPIIEDCINKEITDIFEIKYNFQDLLNTLQGKSSPTRTRGSIPVPIDTENGGTSSVSIPLPSIPLLATNKANIIKIKNIPANINLSYFANYSGKLRDVLKNWCSDFGWSFFWEDDALNFVDTRQRVTPKFTALSNLQSISDTKTIQGTFSRGFISQYLEPGIIAKTECQESQPYHLKCLTLADLFGDFYKPAWSAVAETQGDISLGDSPFDVLNALPDPTNANDTINQIEYYDDVYPDGIPIEKFEVVCTLAHYNETLRHLYTLWEIYGIKNADAAVQAKGKWLDRLGQMKILDVYAQTSSGPQKNKYDLLMNGRYEGSKNRTFSEDEATLFRANKGYFIVTIRNRSPEDKEDLIDLQYRLEENLGTNFLGRHWLRAYVAPFLGQSPQIQPSAQYYAALATNIKDLPFANFNHSYKSTVSKMVSSFIQRQKNYFRQFGMLRFLEQGRTLATNISKKLVRSIIYLQKETAERWSPLKNTQTTLDALVQQNKNVMFKKIDMKQFTLQGLRSLVTDDTQKQLVPDEKLNLVEVYVVYPDPGNSLKATFDFVENENEEFPTYTEGNEPFGLAEVGLLSKKCVRYTIGGVSIFQPAAASVEFELQPKFSWKTRQPEVKEFSTPVYKVYVTNTAKNRGILAKTEAVLINPTSLQGTMETEFTVKQLTPDSTKFLGTLDNECRIKPTQLKQIHDKLSKNLNYSITTPIIRKSFRMMGLRLPSKISIKDGLEKVSVEIDGEGGVFTEITIGNSLFTPPNPDTTEKILERAAITNYWNNRKNPLR